MSETVSIGIAVRGTVAPGYEGVRDALALALAAEPNEPGSQLAVRVGGELVVDLTAGEGFQNDTLTGVYSSTKGAAHLVVAMLVQEGVLDLDRRVAQYWPEFAAEGKGELTLRGLLAHGSGVISVDGTFSVAELADERQLAERLAVQKPYWQPGTGYGYHALVIGALTGEVVRRVTGQTIQEIFEERVRAPYGLDLYLGLPEELEPRYEPIRPMRPTPEQAAQLASEPLAPSSLLPVAFNLLSADGPEQIYHLINHRVVRANGPASFGGVGNARALADLYEAVIHGLDGREALLRPETIAEFTRPHLTGVDLVTGGTDHFGLGFERVGAEFPPVGPSAFGHCGAAGSLAFAAPALGLAYGYVRRRYAFPGGSAPENRPVLDALVAAIRNAS
jgi:CubicO group peptidase (beta-lactamase class C family)